MGNGEGRMQMESPSRMVTINSNVLPVLPARVPKRKLLTVTQKRSLIG